MLVTELVKFKQKRRAGLEKAGVGVGGSIEARAVADNIPLM